jgi:hypothetical protein
MVKYERRSNDKEKCMKHLLLHDCYEKVMAWLESPRGVAVSGVVEEAVRLVDLGDVNY